MKVHHFLLTSLAIAVISGCGSDNKKITPATPITPPAKVDLVGYTTGDPISGATAFCDPNKNFEQDDNEASATTGAEGRFTISMPEADLGKCSVVVNVPANAMNLEYNKAVGKAFVMSANASLIQKGEPIYVSSLTTMLDQVMIHNPEMTSDEAKEVVQNMLGLDGDFTDRGYEITVNSTLVAIEKINFENNKITSQIVAAHLAHNWTPAVVKAKNEGFTVADMMAVKFHSLENKSTKKWMSLTIKSHKPHSAIAAPTFENIPMEVQAQMSLTPDEMVKLIPLHHSIMSATDGNAAKLIADVGLQTLTHGIADGSKFTPSHSATKYDVNTEQTFLANYYYKSESGGFFDGSRDARFENKYALDVSTGDWNPVFHDWNVKTIDVDSGDILLVNRTLTDISRKPTSKVYDVAGKPIKLSFMNNPYLMKSWGHLIKNDAVFSEGSELHKFDVTNGLETFIIKADNKCEKTPLDTEKFADIGNKSVCNFVHKHDDANGGLQIAANFDDIFTAEPITTLDHAELVGPVIAWDGKRVIVAELEKNASTSTSGNVKFYLEEKSIDADGNVEKTLSLVNTQIPYIWTSQVIGSVELCRVNLPTEVTSFGRKNSMKSKDAFLVELDGGLRHGVVIPAGAKLPHHPKALNAEALQSVIASLDNDAYKAHEIKYAEDELRCTHGDTLLAQGNIQTPYPETMKTAEEFGLAVQNCRAFDEVKFEPEDIKNQTFTVYNEKGEETLRAVFDDAAADTDGNTLTEGKASLKINLGFGTPYTYEGDWTHDADTGALTLVYSDFESPATHTIRYEKLDKSGDFISTKAFYLNSQVTSTPVKGIVASSIIKVKPLN
ncbi:MAG: hypothetical protein HAW66_02890 [Shewanella sp.]|nr:hypothetical protein [Shewanella sp.]